ncbi:MAG: pyruvate kinase [Candidatus Bathyarchaeota archaeon]|nr:pyruvate kinase [Candidatus Bathyarchaeota archaeon]
MRKKTKIVCTIGPASLEPAVLEKMVAAGMNCARINTAYGDFDRYKTIVENVRQVSDIPVLVDLKGPEIRLRTDHELVLETGDILEVGFNGEPVRFNHNFLDQMSVGDLVFVDNGRIRMTVTQKREGSLSLRADSSGVISDGKGVNVPNKQLNVSTLSDRDRKLIDFAKEFDIAYLALSFTRSAQDLAEVRSAAQDYKGALVAKIENFDGIQNFDAILQAADGVLIARGDLGVEIATERVPLVQKLLIRKCNQAGKTVITATEMLESMMNNPSPTRAEVSDVANAILDGTDATMLSGETAVGKYPVESVEMMARVAQETEKAAASSVEDQGYVNISDTVSRSIHRICKNMPLNKIVTLTRSGYTARMISRFKVPQPIIAVTYSPIVKKQLELVYGVIPVYIEYQTEADRILTVACNLYSKKLLESDDTVLFTAAFRTKQRHASNLIEIHNIKELLELKENGTIEPAS